MLTRRFWLPVAILLVLAGCQDAAAPVMNQSIVGDVVGSTAGLHILTQAPTAPALETYQVSFWARKDRASTVLVNYQPAAGESVGHPFLRFDVPKGGLKTGGAGAHVFPRDSVKITLTIDPVNLTVDFEPSGVRFSGHRPATLAVWYGNANPDLNADGVVDAADAELADMIAIWGRPAKPAPWMKTVSQTLTGQQWVVGAIRHFSEYAVSW
ncbi:MAG TPA: hypothetical protein VGQ18_05445 [Gemmatimonadales bacterium]|nr:hypothetical protein [Gemmatimonadales bacterium]